MQITIPKNWKAVIREDFEKPAIYKYLTDDDVVRIKNSKTAAGKIYIDGSEYFERDVKIQKLTTEDRDAIARESASTTSCVVWIEKARGRDSDKDWIFDEIENIMDKGVYSPTGRVRRVVWKNGVKQLLEKNY